MRNLDSLKLLSWLVGVVFVIAISFAYSEWTKAAGEEASGAVEAELSELNDSGVSGTVTLTPMENQTKVTVNLTGAPEGGIHPAHIHEGTCDNLGKPAYPLNDIKNGTSETTIDATTETLTSGKYAINVHKSPEELSAYVACGEIQQGGHSH
ncbi:MAG TPA: CHRD domain-containing protein [Thermodesulfobacteriota bacterium]|nr:CHRD domain-containing protein [Thermodesulfobacteriota bacterium]